MAVQNNLIATENFGVKTQEPAKLLKINNQFAVFTNVYPALPSILTWPYAGSGLTKSMHSKLQQSWESMGSWDLYEKLWGFKRF